MKLIIDIPYEAYYTFKCELENRKGNLNALGEIIAKGIPYEERSQGDLISREALKKALNEMFDTVEVMLFDDIIATIDNAPTVDIKDQIAGAYNEGYMCGNKEAEKARPQGEWVLNKDENPECPFCRHSFTYWGNFCGNCGADMRKGGAE